MSEIKEGCSDPRHKDHMCQIIYNGDFERAAQLAENAKYICKQCGRSAREKENLCAPTEHKGGFFGRD
jgi:hypothetical protein